MDDGGGLPEALRGGVPRDTFAGAVFQDGGGIVGPLVTVVRDAVSIELGVVRFSLDLERGLLRYTAQLIRRVDDRIDDVSEQELYDGVLVPADLGAPAPPDPIVRQARAAWASGWRARLEHRFADDPRLDSLVPEAGWISLLRVWAADGPPGPRPHRLHVDPADLDRAARELRPVAPADVAAIDTRVIAAYEIRGWRVLLAPHVRRPHSFEEDRVWVQRVADGAAAIVLMSDPWNAPVQMTVDGDAVAFRDAATWLRDVVLRADLDVAWVDPPDDEDDEPVEWTVSEWLRFRDGWRDRHGEALVDWRVQPDTVADGVRFCESTIFGFDAPTRAAYADGVGLWHSFLREVVDPMFIPLADSCHS